MSANPNPLLLSSVPGILSDREILELCREGMITPFYDGLVREVDGRRVISFGLSSFGYDIRAGEEWYLASEGISLEGGTLDPKAFDPVLMRKVVSSTEVLLPPYSFALTYSVERFRMPKNVIGVALGKSSYARVGLVVNITPLEPGWEGHLTIEVINPTPYPLRVYPGEGIAQILFFSGNLPKVSYDDRKGKYQGQGPGVTFSRL